MFLQEIIFLATYSWSIQLSILPYFLSECTESSDCPNGGQNYECVAELCTCKPGHALDGDACVGMSPNCYFYHSSGTKTLIANYKQSAENQKYKILQFIFIHQKLISFSSC